MVIPAYSDLLEANLADIGECNPLKKIHSLYCMYLPEWIL